VTKKKAKKEATTTDVPKEKSLATALIDIESYAWFLDTASKIFV
jgi:hypothetical protein